MIHCGTQKIETERLILRPFAVKDAQAMYRNWASDDEVTRFLTWPTHPSADVTQGLLEIWTADYVKPEHYQWAIVPKDKDDEPIGSIAVVQMNEQIRMAHIGYCIGRKWWHQGIMTEALQAVMDFLFDEVGFERIEARHDPRNPHSGGVMKKCGMQYEGTLRKADWNNQGICDVACYAMLKADR